MTTVNLRDLYKETGGGAGAEPLPAGTYRLEVVSAKGNAAKAKVTPIYKAVGGPYNGQKVLAGEFYFGSDGAAGVAFQNLKGFGLDKAYFDQDPNLDKIAADIVGVQVDVELVLDEWPKGTGTMRNKIGIGKVLYVGRNAPTQAGVPTTASAAPLTPPPPTPAAPELSPVPPVPTPPVPPAGPGDPAF